MNKSYLQKLAGNSRKSQTVRKFEKLVDCHSDPFACHSEQSEESHSSAQDRLHEESLLKPKILGILRVKALRMTFSDNIKSVNVAIIGFGREGKSLAGFLYRKMRQNNPAPNRLLKNTKIFNKQFRINRPTIRGGASITVCDKNPKIETRQYPHYTHSVREIGSLGHRAKTGFLRESSLANYKFRLGKNYLKGLEKFNIVYLSPGVPPHLPEIKKARQKGVKISSATELFFDLYPAKIIGITGTKGKGTVATILYKMLKARKNPEREPPNTIASGELRGKSVPYGAGADIKQKNAEKEPKIFLVGNIGRSAIEILSRLKKNDLVIMELSSFQLQNLKKSPHIAVVLKITSDHLDYHKNLKEYFAAKANILRWQKPDDIAIIHGENSKLKILKKLGGAKKILFDANSAKSPALAGINFAKMKIPGKHNLENMIAAAITAKILKVKTKNIQSIINNFKGREHRLEFVKSIGGAKYYNDSAATNPDATIAAILSFKEPKILIMGGQSKGNNYKKLGKIIAESNVRKIILFGENQKEIAKNIKLATKYEKYTKIRKSIIFANNIKKTVKIAKKIAENGDVALFSPASSSFDQFKNYEERGLAFKKEL